MEKTEIYEALGQALRKRRDKLGLTQHDVAEHVQLSRASITNIELGRQSVLVDQLYSFAKALRTDPVKLLPTASLKIKKSTRESLSPQAENWIERVRKSA